MNPNRPGAPGAPAAATPPAPPSAPRDPATERLREDLIHPDPLLDCLLEVCRLHGVASSRAALSAGLPLENGRLTLALAERAAQRAGLSTKLQRLRADRIDTATLPAILVLRGSGACVLLGWTEDGDARVLATTKLIGGGESSSVTFKTDGLAGKDLTFFCSFPGHFAMMKGSFKVN